MWPRMVRHAAQHKILCLNILSIFLKTFNLLCGYQTSMFVSDNASKCQKATTWAGEMAPWVACPTSLDPGNLGKKAGKVCSCLQFQHSHRRQSRMAGQAGLPD